MCKEKFREAPAFSRDSSLESKVAFMEGACMCVSAGVGCVLYLKNFREFRSRAQKPSKPNASCLPCPARHDLGLTTCWKGGIGETAAVLPPNTSLAGHLSRLSRPAPQLSGPPGKGRELGAGGLPEPWGERRAKTEAPAPVAAGGAEGERAGGRGGGGAGGARRRELSADAVLNAGAARGRGPGQVGSSGRGWAGLGWGQAGARRDPLPGPASLLASPPASPREQPDPRHNRVVPGWQPTGRSLAWGAPGESRVLSKSPGGKTCGEIHPPPHAIHLPCPHAKATLI